ncbi:MAG: TrbI/VirB10 family protein [Rickettsiales bacterium]|nr:TrbI/VirB10 family protein [Rickettsiales bacterium]
MEQTTQPPDDPFAAPPGNGNGEDASGPLDTGAPNVAASKNRVMLVLGGLGVLVLFLLYNLFFRGETSPPPPEELEVRPIVQSPIEPPPLPIEEPPLPEPPALVSAPPIPEPTNLPIINQEDDSALKEQLKARQRSEMVVINNDGGGLLGGGTTTRPANADGDPNSQFSARVANSEAEKSVATRIGDLRRIIAQGRLISATMESVVNTDLPAPIRAIVSRDVYGEAGTIPLIPAGSRLIGSYNTELTGGQTRVFIVWTRVLRPDGIDVKIDSPLVDQIGQAGIGGIVDNKFQFIFSRAVMASVVSIAFALGSDEINPNDSGTSTTTSTTGTTQDGNAASLATVNALNRLGALTESFLQRFLDIGPTIIVDQGTPVNVFVNRDLIFPAELVGTQFIQ